MPEESFERRLREAREEIRRAAERADRNPASVEILPVTKGHLPSAVRTVAEAGLGRVAENRVSEAEEKMGRTGRLDLSWHMVGHLQRNKARLAVELFDVVESVDSHRLARKLHAEAEKAGVDRLEVLVQVNCSGEEAKYGFSPEEAVEGVRKVCGQPRLRVRGLMTMAPLTSDEEVLRSTFAECRRLYDRCAREVEDFESDVLSMGMSNDYPIAVEEGSTRVRLGTALFGERRHR